jgi:TadE-like protein
MNASSTMKHSLRSNKGQTLIELALIFPLMLALVYGAIEIGSVISAYLTITHTAREGANLTSRGTLPDTALTAIITAADPTIRATNQGQWRVIYSKITQAPGGGGPPYTYRVESQIIRGNFGQTSKIGTVGQTITLPGIQNVGPAQTFHGIEVYYDYTPNVMTYVGTRLIDKTFYERAIFTNVSNS